MVKITQYFLTENDCFKKGGKHKVKGLMWHSTGANNPYLKRYIGPDNGKLGKNQYNNHWNQPGIKKCVHAFIGKLNDETVEIYQTLPWDMPGWHSGSGAKGSSQNANNTGYIGFEICEDDLTDKKYFEQAYELGIQLSVYLVKKYNIPIENVISHREGHLRGIASNHGDPDHWLRRYGLTMDDVRKEIQRRISSEEKKQNPINEPLYRVRKKWSDAASQIGAFKLLENAIKLVNQNPEYKVYDSNGKIVYEIKKEEDNKANADKYTLVTSVNGYYTAADAKNRKNPRTLVARGTYYVYKRAQGMINVTTKKGVPGSWINPADNNKENEIKVGQKVKVKTTATKYATGQTIPSWVKGRPYTVQQIKNDRVLLKEILSWVFKKDVEY